MGHSGPVYRYVRKQLRRLYWKFPHTVFYMFHHVEANPPVCMSGCRLNRKTFCQFSERYSRALSADKILSMKIPRGNYCAYTFDDGLEDVYTIAYPLLKARGIPFTVFILTRMLDTPGYLTKEQVRELSKDPIVTIGVHGTMHRVLTRSTDEECREELFTGKKELEDIIGRKVSLYAYSHGGYNDHVLELVKEAGYEYAFSVRPKPYNIFEKKHRYTIPRCNIDDASVSQYLQTK